MSIMTKLKSMPTSYWVVGLGAAALGVDYLVEGESSIVSSIWRGMTGGGRDSERTAPLPAAPGPRPGGALPLRAPMMVPQAIPGIELLIAPHLAHHHHRHRRYYPAHEPHHVRERRFREWPRRGYLPPEAEHRHPHADHHFDWER